MQNQNPDKVRCGLIGLGHFGKNYLRLLQDTDGVVLCAVANNLAEVFDVHKNLLFGIRTTTNAEDIFSDPLIDVVFIVTPPSTHYSLIEAGLKAGKNVFVEKPMVLSLAEAKKVQALVKKSGKMFMTGYQYLFNENVLYIKREIEKGSFGNILEFKSEHFQSPARADVDIFWDAGSHPMSVFQYLFEPKKMISAEGEMTHDSVLVKVKFENAPLFEIALSYFGKIKTRKITIVGEKATAVLDETREKNKLAIIKNGKTIYPEIDSKEPLRTELEHFIDCVRTGETPLSNVDFGSQITEWLETISKEINRQ